MERERGDQEESDGGERVRRYYKKKLERNIYIYIFYKVESYSSSPQLESYCGI